MSEARTASPAAAQATIPACPAGEAAAPPSATAAVSVQKAANAATWAARNGQAGVPVRFRRRGRGHRGGDGHRRGWRRRRGDAEQQRDAGMGEQPGKPASAGTDGARNARARHAGRPGDSPKAQLDRSGVEPQRQRQDLGQEQPRQDRHAAVSRDARRSHPGPRRPMPSGIRRIRCSSRRLTNSTDRNGREPAGTRTVPAGVGDPLNACEPCP